MRQRALGRTGLSVSEIGLGCSRLYVGPTGAGATEGEVVGLVHAALDLGCNCFDTAPSYGGSESEANLGRALRDRRTGVVLVTKFGLHPDRKKNFDPALLAGSVDGSLRRLMTDYIDVLLLHNPPPEFLSVEHPIHAIAARLKEQGKIRHYGVSVDFSDEVCAAIESGRFEVLEILYNVFQQEPRRAFADIEAAGLGVLVKSPLDSGWLGGRYHAGSRFDDGRRRWTDDDIQRRARYFDRVAEVCPQEVARAHLALRFALGPHVVSALIPASRTRAQLEQNTAASGVALPTETVQKLEELWEQEFGREPLPW